VGCAIVLNRTVHRGAHGGAGEIGHIPVTLDGPRCHCGAEGCLEAHIGDEALVRQARARGIVGPRGTVATLLRAAERGDEAARELYHWAGSVLGRGLSGVANTLDPEAIILLGEGTVAWEHWRGGFDATFRSHVMPDRRDVPLVLEDWADERWAQGAAALVMASSFDSQAAGDQGGLVRALLQSVPAVTP
jgi:predicted NBD/HSP70 family sugar kinase